MFGGLLNSHDPIGSITPVLRFLGSNGFSIQVPEHGLHIDPSLLLQPQRLFQQLQGLGVAPRPFELDAEDVEGVLGETPAPRRVKRKAAGPLSRLRIKIIGLTPPALLQFGGLPQLPQPLRLFLLPPPQQQDKRKDE
jgi:hypothetical protein